MYACEIYHGGPLEIDKAVFVKNLRKNNQIGVFFDKIASLRWTKLYRREYLYTNVLFQITKAPNFIQHHKSKGRRCETFLKNVRR